MHMHDDDPGLLGQVQPVLRSEELATRPALPRVLGAWDLTVLCLIAVFLVTRVSKIASGGGSAFLYLGLDFIAFLIPSALICAQLHRLFPAEGAVYLWTHKALGSFWDMFVGFFCHWWPGAFGLSIEAGAVVTFLQAINPSWLQQPWQQGMTEIIVLGSTLLLCILSQRSIQRLLNLVFVGYGALVVLLGVAGVAWLASGHVAQGDFPRQGWQISKTTLPLFATVILSLLGMEVPLNLGAELANAAQRPPVPEDRNGSAAGLASVSTLALGTAPRQGTSAQRSLASAPGHTIRRPPADLLPTQAAQDLLVWQPAPPVRPRKAAPALVLQGVTKVYRQRSLCRWWRNEAHLAVDHLTLEVEQGIIFGLLGPNGSGKTTMINLLCGFLRPTSGSIRILGFDTRRARDLRHIRQRLGAVPQETALYEELTAQENLAFHAGLYGVPYQQRERRIKEMLHLAGLFERRHDRVKTFSGGMKRRLAIARALLHDPQLLYLDEPTLGVDVQSRRAIWEYIRALSVEGKTVLITTNQLDEAQTVCHRLAIIDHGRLIDQGTPASLKERYGASVVELDLATPLDSLERLVRVEGVLRVSPNGPRTHVTITTEQMNEVLPRLLAHLPSPPTSIAVHEPSLDDVFLHLTGAALRD